MPELVGFQTMVILVPNGMTFDAVGVVGLLYIRCLEAISKPSYILFESDPMKTHTHCMLT
jgi:hypothetical protein